MKWYKSLSFALLFLVTLANAQSANRFFYELTFKPKKDSTKTEKEGDILEIASVDDINYELIKSGRPDLMTQRPVRGLIGSLLLRLGASSTAFSGCIINVYNTTFSCKMQ
jgi:hypothetical protein